ncbi:AAA family ATPase [Candidatus Woesearchaeota archaeon]|nr:AAA family ATPase [Candidatus Woesearchaeota archaeon]
MSSLTTIGKDFQDVFKELGKVVVGQQEVMKQMLVAIMCNGNALLESVPGLAKTLTIKTLAEIMDLKFSRIQNTPDLMPSDITGTYIIEEEDGKRKFKFQPGPIFANIVLADEINRATPKTQAALLEAMQEKQVTVGNKTFKLEEPFFILATQNPIEQEGSLALSQAVFINGQLKTGKELLELAGDNCIKEDKKGIKLYDINAWTLSLNTSGKLEKKNCFLYTLPYSDEMLVVTSNTGKKITVTKNHPFLVNENGIITWKKAEELTKQDYMINPARIDVNNIEPQKVMPHQEALKLMAQKPLPKEIIFDEDFAFWIAFLLSDGSIGEKCVEAVQKNYPASLDRFIDISEKYGFKASIRTKKGVRHARIYSKPLVEYLKIRFNVVGGKDKEIPSWFLKWSDEMNREFLKAFISLESSIRDNRIVFTQKSANNVNIISYMLLREGILSWIRHDGKIFRLKIQGKDFMEYLKNVGWVDNSKIKGVDLSRITDSSFRVVPVDRRAILRLTEVLGLNSFHTLKGRANLTERKWYGSYKGIKEGETLMAVDSLKQFVDDIRNEIEVRDIPEFKKNADIKPREFAAAIGTPITTIAEQLEISKNQVWKLYSGESVSVTVNSQIKEFLLQKYTVCMEEAKSLLKYCEALLSEDIYYDKIKSIEYTSSEGMAFGLTVPELQNYIAGFGGCGINHNTYPLPEAQQDRFLLKIKLDYPSFEEELEIVDRFAEGTGQFNLRAIIKKEHIARLQTYTKQVPIANDIKKYAVKVVTATRQRKDLIEYGASPRASIAIVMAAKAKALIEGRKFVSKEDIKEMAFPVLRHRIILNFEAQRKNLSEDDVIKELL